MKLSEPGMGCPHFATRPFCVISASSPPLLTTLPGGSLEATYTLPGLNACSGSGVATSLPPPFVTLKTFGMASASYTNSLDSFGVPGIPLAEKWLPFGPSVVSVTT